MTTFEIIILLLIYLFGFGYTVQIFLEENNPWLRTLGVLLSLILAIYFPLSLAADLYKKLNKEDEK